MQKNVLKQSLLYIEFTDMEVIMQLKRDTEYALRIMVYMAEYLKSHASQKGISSSNVISKTGIPLVSFNRICERLGDKGIIVRKNYNEGEKMLYPGKFFWEQSIFSLGECMEGNMDIFAVFDKNTFLTHTYGKELMNIQKEVKDVLMDTIENQVNILTDSVEYAPQVFVNSFEESNILLGVRVWVRTEDYWPTRWALLESIKNTFDEHNITIPYNQLDVNLVTETVKKSS